MKLNTQNGIAADGVKEPFLKGIMERLKVFWRSTTTSVTTPWRRRTNVEGINLNFISLKWTVAFATILFYRPWRLVWTVSIGM